MNKDGEKCDNSDGSEDKYLELVFDLKDFNYEGVDFSRNREGMNVLIVRAVRNGLHDAFIRRYVLPGKYLFEDDMCRLC